jgi:hypothetical protein
VNIIEYKPAHLQSIDLQEGQAYLSSWVTPDLAEALGRSGWAYTGMDGDTPVGCAGVINVWQGRGICWAYLSASLSSHRFLEVHRAVSRFLETCYVQRLEMTVDCDFEQGHRWAEMLGFEMEAERMQAYRPDGGDCALYARVL